MASKIARVRFSFTSPPITLTFQGWMLLPLALRLATARRCSTVARLTGVGKKARTDLREVIASSTAFAASAGVMFIVSCIDGIQGFQALRHLAEEQTLDVIVRQQILSAAFIGQLSEVHNIAAVGDRQRPRGLLLDHHY